ncbi:MAG TPA: DUF5686 and carboxypeptidase regulatory-like domain-containing protein [Chitinophagaceae bacterium]|nr:DUF5686 and carboxypeptidase regulatory-like domain-containing protein [Chitinophagaceae bacterium]
MKLIVILIFISGSVCSTAQQLSGVVTDDHGVLLPNASIIVQGTTHGTNANSEGEYFLHFNKPGTYTIICQHVGYKRDVRTITITGKDVVQNFILTQLDFTLEEVIVRSGENPANEIIRRTIEQRSFYAKQLDKFSCEVYTKGILKLRDYPKKILGQKLDFGDGDTSKQKIIYLSETISSYAVEKPNNSKTVVHSSKVSGQGNGFGLSAPHYYSIYENIVTIGSNLNPRGFISPIAENATNYYRYKYEGAFFEDGVQINRVRVIPKRKYEPLFSGYINIVEDEWRVHSLKLLLTKESQMELLDSLQLEQIYVPATKDVWVIQSQIIYPSAKILGVDAHGSFINMYSKFNHEPVFGKKFFDNTILVYHDSSSRKTESFWDEARPMKLLDEEANDYRKKDSLERLSKNPSYLDSVDRGNNKFSILRFLVLNQSFQKESKRTTYSIRSLTEIVSYNIVEGLVLDLSATYTKRIDTMVGRKSFRFTPHVRYGFTNNHLNIYASSSYVFGKKYISSINFSGGKRVFQFNNASPIGVRSNSLATLLGRRNLQKLYEAWYLRGSFNKGIGNGLTWSSGFEFQDRMPLENTTDYSLNNKPGRAFTPNYPTELLSANFKKHQAMSLNFSISWQPKARYIQVPGQKINIGSKWPTMSLSYTRTFHNMFGSDVDYSKWRFSLTDIINAKLYGLFNYRIGIGGFIGNQIVEVQDYQHFNGNISRIATPYLNSFQILPIYEFSNISKFYALMHVEHHFNGFLTNKIPGFKRLNWYLVSGVNAFHYSHTDYLEYFVGLENILKQIRIDYYWSLKDGEKFGSNFRIGLTTRLSRNTDD